jgi:DNA primase
MFNQELRKIEIERIKERIDIISFLSKLGYKPSHWSNTKAFYLSPLRKETKPSFVVYTQKNDWYDFGINKGGSIIDLVMLLFDMHYIEAIQMLRKEYNHLFN